MLKLYFGNKVTTITTIMIISLVAFIVYTFINRDKIDYWGRRTLFIVAYGLIICCYAATRDGLDKTIQCAIDGSCQPGIFKLVSFQTIIGCIGAGIIIISGISTLFVRKQNIREILYFTMSGGILLKIMTIEISRICMQMFCAN